MTAPGRPSRAAALVESALALLAFLAFVLVAFGPKARLLGPVVASAVDAASGRGRLLFAIVLIALALLFVRLRLEWDAEVARPGRRPGAWLRRLRPADLVPIGTFLALLLVLSDRGGRLEVDGPLLFAQLRSVMIDHDLDLTNEFAAFVPERYQYWAEEGRRLGRAPNPTVEPGPAILWSPFFLLAHLLVAAAQATGAPFVADGYGAPYVNAACLGSLVWAFVAVLVTCRIARRFFPPMLCAVCVSAAWLATPLLWYSAFEPGMSHAPAAAAAAAFVWLWLRVRAAPERQRTWLLLAVAAGLLVSTQRYDAYFLVAPLVTVVGLLRRASLASLVRKPRVLAGTAGVVLLVFAATLVPLAYANLTSRHASWLGESHLVGFTFRNWAHPHVVELLFSSRNGLFSWTPLATLGVIGLALLARRDRGLSLTLLLTLALGVYLLAASYAWSGGWSFGSRRLTEAFVLFALGACVVASHLLARPVLLGLLPVVLLVAWNLLLVGQVRRREIPRDETFAFSGAAARAAQRFYERVGHLPAAPAPWVFAARYGTGPDRFDTLVGREPIADLDIAVGTPEADVFLGWGWSYAESRPGGAYRWSEGPASTLLVPMGEPRDYRLAFQGEPGRHPSGQLQTVAVSVNGRAVRSFTLAGGPQAQGMEIPAERWRRGVNEIRFDYGWTVVAGTVPESQDERRIAWRVERFTLQPTGPPPS